MLFAEYRRLILLTEGALGVFSSKTATSVIRYRRDDVVAVVDSQAAGQSLEQILGIGQGIPIVADVAEAMRFKPDALMIGVAPVGGGLPAAMRIPVVDALREGLSIISGLHLRLRDDPELAALAEAHGAALCDVRDPGPVRRVAFGLARSLPVKRVLTVGTDCSSGKMVTSLELRAAAIRAGLDAAFVATGQTGAMIEGWGTAIDAVVSDFAAGSAEMLIERVHDRQICFVEGQGSIEHPGYSGVTLSLLHGVCPDAMIMCTCPTRQYHDKRDDCPIAPIEQQIQLYESLTAPLHPACVVGVAANTAGLDDAEANRRIAALAERTNLPACDPIRNGVAPLLAAVRAELHI
ncbi:MAG: DUF1611 domain-containing protein [Phycisphaerae bacterium]|nr:DUF1611 domain-containing protein [Phycisphaerae bacterium]